MHKTAVNRLAVFYIEITVNTRIYDTAYGKHIIKKFAIFGKSIYSVTFFDIVTVYRNCANAGVHIVIFTEIVLFACKGYPAAFDEGTSNAVSGAFAVGSECTHGAAVFIKVIGNTVNGFGSVYIKFVIAAGITIHGERCAAVDIVFTFISTHILPAFYEFVVDRIVEVFTNFNDAGSGYKNVFTDFANKLSVNDFVIMSFCFDNGTKINYGSAGFAVSSAGITVFSAGCCFIFESSKFRIMFMIRRRNGGKFGCNTDCATEGITVNNTVNNFAVNVYNGFVAHICRSIIGVVYIVVSVKSPDTNRNTYEGVIKSSAGNAGFLNSYSEKFRNLIVFKGCFEAGSNDCAIGFPSVCVVELELCNKFIYVCKVCYVDINIVDGLCFRSFAGIVMTAKFNSSFACNSEGSGKSCGVAEFVFNFECNSVCTCSKSNIAFGGKCVACNSRFYFNTVNIYLARRKIKCCVISNGCGECNIVSIYFSAVIKSNCSIGSGISRCSNGRKNSVVNSGAVVESDIIDIESYYVCSIRFYISTNEGRRTTVTLVHRRHSRQIVIFTDINGSINPSGFRNIRIGCGVKVGLFSGCSGSEHKVILHARCLSISFPVCIGVQLRLECKTFSCCRERVFRNIDPHTEGGCFHSVCNVTKNNNIIGIEKNVIAPACESSIGIIESPCKSTATVSYLTAISGGCNESFTAEIFVELTCKRIGADKGVVYAVILAPFFSFFEAHEACFVAIFKIFKVPDNFGTFTEFNCISKSDFTISNGYVNTCNRSILGCGEIEAVKSTCCIVGKSNGNSIGINIYVCFTGHCNDRKGNGADFFCSGIRNYSRSCGKFENFGVCNGDGFSTDYFAAGKNLNVNSTSFAVGFEFSIFNGTEGIIGKCPGCVCGHCHCVSVGIDCFCTEGINGFGSKDIILGFYVYNVKYTGRCNVGSNENTVCGGALCTVAGNGTHGEGFFTNTFGKEGGGTAAVAVCCPFAAESEHCFAFFIVTETNGVVCAASVVHADNESTVFFNADHGTCRCRRSSFFGFRDEFSIFNNHTEGNTYRMEKSSICKVAVEFGSVKCFYITGYITFCILENIKDGGRRSIFTFDTDIFAVIDKNAGSISVIIKVGVHTADNVISEGILIIFRHIGKFLMGPVSLIGKVFINLVISGNDGYVRVGRVNFNDMNNLSAVTCCVVENDFGLNCCTRNKNIIFFGNNIIVTVGTKCFSIINYVVFFPVRNGKGFDGCTAFDSKLIDFFSNDFFQNRFACACFFKFNCECGRCCTENHHYCKNH